MIQAVYVVFFWILVIEVIIFCFLNMPTPRGWKSKVIKVLTTSNAVKTLMKVHLGCCLLAGLFFYDCYRTENMFQEEKHKLKYEGHGHMGSQLRIGFLSYSILKVQRNKYITFMLIYASLALNVYIQLLNYMYKKRQQFEKSQLNQAKQSVVGQTKKDV